MADIRDRVVEDRGLLKKIQAHFPGFIGYRRKEDLRQADSILRLELAKRINEVRNELENARTVLADEYQLKALEPVGRAILEMQEFEGAVKHAEQGYSGISWAIKVEEEELNRLYEHDLSLLEGLVAIEKKVNTLKAATETSTNIAREISSDLAALRLRFKNRIAYMTNTEVR